MNALFLRRIACALAASSVTLPAVAASRGFSGSGVRLGPLVRVSGRTPFASGCGEPPYARGSTSNPTSEPTVAVDPRNPRDLLTAFMEGRRRVGGAVDDVLMRSSDGGRSWRHVVAPGTTICSGGTGDRNADPTLAFGPDGRAYFSSLPGQLTANGTIRTQLLVHSSANGGVSWPRPARVPPRSGFDDRARVTADPRHPGRAYITWIQRTGPGDLHSVLYFARTTDGGRTWSSRMIYQPAGGPTSIHVLIQATIDVSRGGALVDTFIDYSASASWPIEATRSTDGGRTWSRPAVVATTPAFFPEDPETGTRILNLPIAVSASAPDGSVYVVWDDHPSKLDTRIMVSRSSDAGRSWSRPQAIREIGAEAFLPSVAVSADGTVASTFYDLRRDRSGDRPLTTDVWFEYSRNRGHTWHEAHLAGPFDLRTAYRYRPQDQFETGTGNGGYSLGDYTGLAALGNRTFGAAIALAKPYSRFGNSSIFFRRVTY